MTVAVCVCPLQADKKDSIGVRMALGETQIVAEIRQFLLDNGVVLDSFSSVSFHALMRTHTHTHTCAIFNIFAICKPGLLA